MSGEELFPIVELSNVKNVKIQLMKNEWVTAMITIERLCNTITEQSIHCNTRTCSRGHFLEICQLFQIVDKQYLGQSICRCLNGLAVFRTPNFLVLLICFFFVSFLFLLYYVWKSGKDRKRDERSIHLTDFEKCRSKGLHSLNFSWLLRRMLMN